MYIFSDELKHIGTPHDGMIPHSGRHPYGSGKTPNQRNKNLFVIEDELANKGVPKKETDKLMLLSSAERQRLKSVEKTKKQMAYISRANELYKKLGNKSEVARQMSKEFDRPFNESVIRNYLKTDTQKRLSKPVLVANTLKDEVKKKKFLDISSGVEQQLGIKETMLGAAVKSLEKDGYRALTIKVPQATNKQHKTNVKVLIYDPEEKLTPGDIYKKHLDDIKSPKDVWFEDDGRTVRNIKPPHSISSDRVAIKYAEDGGTKRDGLIELRPGVDDISIGKNQYAQIRMLVDGDVYLKGMAIYNDKLPKGVDVRFNTNKPNTKSKREVLKSIKDDPDNPFGTTVRQLTYIGKDGKEHISAANIVNDHTDWDKWSKTLPSQFLSKQPIDLVKHQLKLSIKDKHDEFNEIKQLTNGTIRKKLLTEFADECDKAAVDLKAKALPGQSVNVLLPFSSIKDNEVYAPNYENGTKLALIRYPHGGTFEIPVLTVNNNNREAKKAIGNSPNAIGINHKPATQLSGADFDGDTVTTIPLNTPYGKKIQYRPYLKELENFETGQYEKPKGAIQTGPKSETKKDGIPRDGFAKQREMGIISNLITDMTAAHASEEEVARAIRHSMVIIDAEKHNLDWKKSALDNRVTELHKKYQGKAQGGAGTVMSRAKHEVDVLERKEYKYTASTHPEYRSINPTTGEKIYKNTNRYKVLLNPDKTPGSPRFIKTDVLKTQKSNLMSENDPYALISQYKYPVEYAYAEYATEMKNLGNKARLEYLGTKETSYNPSARKQYKNEVDSLNDKLSKALIKSPKERRANMVANTIIKSKMDANPNLTKDEESKLRSQTIAICRRRAGIGEKEGVMQITDKEWEAIQAGAVSKTTLSKILDHADSTRIKELATPKASNGLTLAQISRIQRLSKTDHSQSEIAKALGVSVSVVNKVLNE